MTDGPQRAFRAAALDRAASPEQLDHVVVITKPADWIFTFVLCIALVAAVLWGIFGRVPTRVSGEGILIGRGGKVVDAVSAAAGRLQAIAVSVGDHVSKGPAHRRDRSNRHQAKAQRSRRGVSGTRAGARRPDAKVAGELAAKSQNFAKLEVALNR